MKNNIKSKYYCSEGFEKEEISEIPYENYHPILAIVHKKLNQQNFVNYVKYINGGDYWYSIRLFSHEHCSWHIK